MRIGHGFDIHSFGSMKPLIIGGVVIPYDQGLIAYSDGDLVIHSVIDALLGATSMGDIGTFFPSTNKIYKNINSRILLKKIWEKIQFQQYNILNIDITIIAEYPKMLPYINCMRLNLSSDLNTKINHISIKSSTSQKIGCIGRKEGIACHAIVLLTQNQ